MSFRIIFGFIVLLAVSAGAEAQIIADLDADWIHGSPGDPASGEDPEPIFTPGPGWSFQWNPTGVDIGDSANYVDLIYRPSGTFEEPKGGRLDTGATAPADGEEPTPDFLNSIVGTSTGNNLRVHEGNETDENPKRRAARWVISGREAAFSTDGKDHFIIIGYTIQEGEVEEGGSGIVVNTAGNTGDENLGWELRTYLNDTLIDTTVREPQGTEGPGDVDLYISVGTANVGDTIYLAYLADNDTIDKNDRRWFSAVTIGTNPGDFNEDGNVDGSDFLAWQRDGGQKFPLADWQNNYGASFETPQLEAATVPEPSSCFLVASIIVLGCGSRARSYRRS